MRYLVFGLWNTVFAWLAFALIWKIGDSFAPLWALVALAHGVATTQAFWVQRRWVFQAESGALAAQYLRFQGVFLGLLGIGMFMLEALYAQGVHPLAGQVLVMATQAASGFLLGRSFTFSAEPFRVQWLGMRIAAALRGTGVVWLAFLTSLAIFYRVLARPFYASLEHVGHDFALSATGLLEGRFWLQSNGLIAGLFNPPWFTPAWCAGAAFFTDPQAGYYSPVQWLALVLDPFQAIEVGTLFFAALAFWGGYLAARRLLNWQAPAALVFAILGMAHAFMPLRSAVGESGYQPLYVWPWLLLALCWPVKGGWRGKQVGPVLGVTLALTAWLHFGFAGMMVPSFLGVMLLGLVLVLTGRARLDLLLARAALGGVLAIALNGSKLYEAASLMRNFPRDFYGMPGFAALQDALVAPVMALVLPSQWTTFFGMRRLSGVQFSVLPHEWALEFGLGALAVALVAGALVLQQRRQGLRAASPPDGALAVVAPAGALRWLLWAAVLLLLVLPPLLLWNQGSLRDMLKQIPILNSAAWPMRWIVIYVPLVQWLLAWPVQQVLARLPAQQHAWWYALGAGAVIWLGQALAPNSYYLDPHIQAYDPKPVLRAHAQSLRAGAMPLERIEITPERGLARNDAMLDGASQAYCYNPLYGYRLEALPQPGRLRGGPALALDPAGHSMIFNPACLVHPAENACQPGDGFRMDDPAQRQAAEHFVARKPFAWQRPWLGQVLSWVSQGLFWLILCLLAVRLWQALLAAALPPGTGPPPPADRHMV